ncbi:polysaccharide deacetylase family protein [Bradyrhizobium sp. 180]|uniref:polysaccharide deacetylase family protein n=1 Tax=unclassified Bradyrhizobium TaxID=2631580 RepID=UPI001FF8A856|nr:MULTISPECIES: polysaccharide deacetylase family protein [unclassified Bradyrhizobium]MCK1494524.1 polysaccharide deacetylase family protein [Bradyrhizobium sp. 180]MCK1595390.1 polysaccharide deacetylase family protein [Bradyrhizobium sp. 164]MCK1620307.1 polysaccharide deacetylase family protein [Bradyrhizobium sp. 159]MCK1666961.1 polysaccharide deacetylase family protein [Bradyrhizobium sp. 153]MCK1755095.1 polysaccharide deacetylase family protein [Bradyrhizobium sp. 137]
MIGSSVGLRTRSWTALGLLLGLLTTASPAALAADCPGHPDALGTSRTLVVDPREHPLIGTMQYRETLPLKDHEVVLTFDDGPLPKYSNQVLQILADECIKATFFIIGNQAKANPEGVRKLVAAGHTVGTHSMDHPLTFDRMPIEKAEAEINGGIEWTAAAMTDPTKLAPFFRIPGLMRAEGVENHLISRGIQVWSADFPADDWRHVSSDRVYQLAIQRLEAKGKGILLLHDIQARTVAALPKIIRDLKARGYRIVHVVPATADRPATPTTPVEWLLHSPTETTPIARWPRVPNFVFAQTRMLPAPALADLNAQTEHQPLLPRRTMAQANVEATLPVPGRDLFAIPEGSVEVLLSTSLSRRATRLAMAAQTPHAAKDKAARGKAARSQGRRTAQAAPAAPKPAAQTKSAAPHPTGVASLKKRA